MIVLGEGVFYFFWDGVYSIEGLWLLSEVLVLGSDLFWPILPICQQLWYRGWRDVSYLGGG